MNTARTDDIGKLLLRITLGGLMLFHGLSKVFQGADGIHRMVASAGLPQVLGYGVYLGEAVAPALLLLGLFTRPAALVVAFNMLVALLLVHTGHFFTMSKMGGWSLELQAFFFMNAVIVAVMGPGAFRLGKPATRWWG